MLDDVRVSLPQPSRAELQRAVDRANALIRQFWMGMQGEPPTVGDWLFHNVLVAEWNAAMIARDAAGPAGGEDKAARAAA
jgi:hypothetical protein